MKTLWQAIHKLADVLKKDLDIKEYSGIISTLKNNSSGSQVKGALNNFLTSDFLKSQPFLIGWYFCQLENNERIHALEGSVEFCVLSEIIARKIHCIIEWLRSQLPRYPNLLVPHVAPNSNNCGQEVLFYHRFPWFNHFFNFKFESKKDFLSYFQTPKMQSQYLNILGQSVDELADQLMDTETWQSFKKRSNELDKEDVANLVMLINEFQEKTREDVVTMQAGEKLYRIAQYKSAILNEIKLKANYKFKHYYEEFEAVELLLQIISWILSSLVIYGPTERIEQYNTFIAERSKIAVSDKIIKINMNYNINVLRFLRIGQVLYFKNELNSFEGAIVIDNYSLKMSEMGMDIGGHLLKNSKDEF